MFVGKETGFVHPCDARDSALNAQLFQTHPDYPSHDLEVVGETDETHVFMKFRTELGGERIGHG